MTLAAALASLHERVPLGMRLGLEPMRAACAAAGHPEAAFPVVHVAGTNGKGSTCAMVEAIARASGLRTGLYTSPHLVRFAERIRVDGEPTNDLEGVLAEALSIGADLSFFETATLAAFLAFRAARVELAVVEVGIGGRLDATNVIPSPRCSAITGIALDHQAMLGDTLALIAAEKAAVARSGVPIVLGAMPPEARASAETVIAAAGARIVETVAVPDDAVLALEGPHQRANAGVAWTITRELGIGEAARRAGLASARWPGRLERIPGGWLLDGAHNPDGARALVQAVAGEDIGAVVFGALADKSWREMLAVLAPLSANRVYVGPKGRAPVPLEELATLAPGVAAGSLDEALALARAQAGTRTVVIAGSLYLVGEARAKLLGLEGDPIVAL